MKFQVKKFRELNGFSRFLRLKWLILLIAFPAFVIWLFWPVPTYDGYAPTYIAVDNGKDFLGVVTVTKFANPWEAAAFVSDETSPAFRELLLKDSGIKCVWSTKKGTSLPGDLY
ncbi:MAG: hypothetical protein P1U58_18650, partial [Verrucomicrobiales bacterium]|nr:hypothetical protein [Verrucomicrobiales bacterium]